MSKDHFQEVAERYDHDPKRVGNVDTIANAILATVSFRPTMRIMDFGAGTGLLLARIAPHVDHITAVDVSPSMIEQLEMKRATIACKLEVMQLDLTTACIDGPFDGIISSMTLHHIENVHALLVTFRGLLADGGFIALADLEPEDGSFHSENTGVFHLGFDQEKMALLARKVGFREVTVQSASVVHKEQGEYPVFLLTAVK